MTSPTQWTWLWVSSRSWWWTREAWRAAVHGVAKSQTRQSDSTDTDRWHRIVFIFLWLISLFSITASKSYMLLQMAKFYSFTDLISLTTFYPNWVAFLWSVQFSRSVMSYSLQTRGLQHTRPPCPSLTPGVYSNSCPLSRWCHPTISSFVVPFSSCPQSFPASLFLPMSQLFTSGGQSVAASALASVLPMNIKGWFPLGLTGLISSFMPWKIR